MSSTSGGTNARATDVATADDSLIAELADGRRLTVPLAWFPRLLHASPEQRLNWRLIGDGQGIRLSDIDEDVSVGGLLRGTAAPELATSAV
jgi:hypothetical protein